MPAPRQAHALAGLRRATVVALLGTVLLAVAVSPASAIVPPQDCGTIIVKGKRYTIKADQLRCPTARAHARAYLARRRVPTGYRCRTNPPTTKIRFTCERGVRTFFAIRR